MTSLDAPYASSAVVKILLCLGIGLSLLLGFRLRGEGAPEDSNVVAVSFDASGDRLLAGTQAGEIFLLNVHDGTVLESWHTQRSWLDRRPAPFNSIAFAPDGTFAVFAGTTELKLIAFAHSGSSTDIGTLSRAFGGAAVSPNGRQAAAISSAEKLLVWNLNRPSAPLDFGNADAGVYGASAFSPDGRSIALAGHTLSMLDAKTGEKRWSHPRDTYANLSVAFRPDGNVLASGSQDSTIKLWSAGTGNELSILRGHHGYVEGLSFGPDGKTLASWTSDGQLFLWNLSAATNEHLPTKLAGSTGGATFSSDSRCLASGEPRKTIGFWDTQTGKKIRDISITSAQLR
ncbi:MAG TPA: hypothetical protein VHP80_00945 [Candidatus Acidoferrum sp.]|nr:hypothetical protein [Candidatus Acidoferrum sp.]